jgi:hypothetical protein
MWCGVLVDEMITGANGMPVHDIMQNVVWSGLVLSSVSVHVAMGRKPTGAKPGRKTDLSAEQEAFLLTFGDRFRDGADNGTLYTEVTNHWIEKFGYSGLNPHNRKGISSTDLCLEADISTLPADKLQQIEDSRKSAQKLVRMVCFDDMSLASKLIDLLENRQLVPPPLQCSSREQEWG